MHSCHNSRFKLHVHGRINVSRRPHNTAGGCAPPVYMKWIDSHSRVVEGVTVGSCKNNRLLFVNDLVLLASSEQGLQHALDRFGAACHQAGIKIGTTLRYHVSPENQAGVCCKRQYTDSKSRSSSNFLFS